MANSVYNVNRGINQSIEFKGLKAQYIWYLGGGIVLLLIIFAAMYIIGLPSFVSIGLILIAGTFLVIKIYAMSNKYGEHGMMKALAKSQVPKVVKFRTRKVFIDFKYKANEQKQP